MTCNILIPQQSREDLKPGPTDNTMLRGNYDEELKLELVEGLDYILLPDSQAKWLYDKYKVLVSFVFIYILK